MTTTPKISRKVRLHGDIKERGGGMPTPAFAQAMLTYLHDHQHASLQKLTQVNRDSFMDKTGLLARTYHKHAGMQGDPYMLYTQDLLDELSDKKLVQLNGAGYVLGPDFKLGVPLKDVGTVHPPEQRKALDRAAGISAEVAALTKELRPDGKGLRLLRPDHVEHLADAMRAFGYDARFPVTMDQEGRILDGRHRQAAAKKAGIEYATRVIHVASDLEALEYAFNANVAAGFTKHELDRIAKFLCATEASVEAIGKIIGRAGKRALIEGALIKDPSLSSHAIAKKLGVDDESVEKVRLEVNLTSGYRKSDLRICADGRMRPAKRARLVDENSTATTAKVLRLLKAADKPMTTGELQKHLPDAHPHTVIAATSKLAKEGYLTDSGQRRRNQDGGGKRPSIAYTYNPETRRSPPAGEDRASAKVNKILAMINGLSNEERTLLCRAICHDGARS